MTRLLVSSCFAILAFGATAAANADSFEARWSMVPKGNTDALPSDNTPQTDVPSPHQSNPNSDDELRLRLQQ